jgi:hypothetical protein
MISAAESWIDHRGIAAGHVARDELRSFGPSAINTQDPTPPQPTPSPSSILHCSANITLSVAPPAGRLQPAILPTAMLLSRYLAVAASSLAISAAAVTFFHPGAGQGQIRMGMDDPDDNQVPGDNPLTYCGEPETYLLEIEDVTLTPNPPAA